jgi:hypothetical protein
MKAKSRELSRVIRVAAKGVMRNRPFALRDKVAFASLEKNKFAIGFLEHMGLTNAPERAKFWSDNNAQVFKAYRTLFNLEIANVKKEVTSRQSDWDAVSGSISRSDPETFELFTDVLVRVRQLTKGVSILSQSTLQEEALVRASIDIFRSKKDFHSGKGPSCKPSVELVTAYNTAYKVIKAERKEAADSTEGIDYVIAAKSAISSVEPLSSDSEDNLDDDSNLGIIILKLQRSIRRDFCTHNRLAGSTAAEVHHSPYQSGRRR